MKLIITNNPLVFKNSDEKSILYLKQQDYLDVLKKARDYIHINYKLLTHPLSSNFLADKTLYKTIVLTQSTVVDMQSLSLIEDAIILVGNSLQYRDKRISSENIKRDLQFIDFEIIKNAL